MGLSPERDTHYDEYKITLTVIDNKPDISSLELELINAQKAYNRFQGHSDFWTNIRAGSYTDASKAALYDKAVEFKYNPYSQTIEINDTALYDEMVNRSKFSEYSHFTKISLNSGRVSQRVSYTLKKSENFSGKERVVKDFKNLVCDGTDRLLAALIDSSGSNTFVADNSDPNKMIEAASGTGFFVNNKGDIITNSHVVEGCSEMKFLREGQEITSKVVATDPINDIALLSSDFKNKDYFEIRENDVVRAENIKAIGYGFGKSYSSDVKITAGIVSSLAGYADNYSEFQMDAAIQSGNSGGPVIDDDGFLVGISVAALDSIGVLEETGTLPQNVNYAIKSSTLKQFLESNKTKYHQSSTGFFSSLFNQDINEKIDNATVYLSCYMTYAQIEENMTTKVMFINTD